MKTTHPSLVSGLCAVLLGSSALTLPAFAQAQTPVPQQGQQQQVIRQIQVLGNQRIEANTVASYLLVAPGDLYDPERIDLSVKTLFATGLFADVLIEYDGQGTLIVQVIENPIINRVIFEGNNALKTDKIEEEVEAQPRAIFTRARAQEDVQRILELYRRSGRFAADVTPKVVEQDQNRVDLIFEISEGPITGVQRINFLGNEEFSDRRLRSEIVTEESRFWRFFSSNDNYDPDRLEYDRELLRQFYTDKGYADFRVISSVAELVPDQKDFFITFTIDEGELYNWGDISVETELEALNEDALLALIGIQSGDLFKASRVEDAIDNLTFAAGTAGYAFVDIQPGIKRNKEDNTVDVVFEIQEGPRVYIERIDIVGNTRTLDHVIRRELELVEGDAFNRILLDRSRNKVRALRFFEDVVITEVPGTQADRAIVEVAVTEQPTGELSFGAGFSSADAWLIDLSITERNLRGRGQLARFVIRSSSRTNEIDLRFTEPRFLDRNLAAGIQLFNVSSDFIDEAGFRSDRIGGQLTLAFPVTEFTSLTTRYGLRQDEIEIRSANNVLLTPDNCNPLVFGRSTCDQLGSRLTSSLGYTFRWDRRNDPIVPTRGFDLSLSQDFAGVGGDTKYLRSELRAGTYYGIRPNWIASLNFTGGYIQGWGGDDIRINDRFFKGASTFRGFDVAGLGPVSFFDANGDGIINNGERRQALGGNLYAIGTAELAFPTPLPEQYGIGTSLFVEMGTVGLLDDSFKEISPSSSEVIYDDLSLRGAAGLSVFWDSPFGPIRFDFSYPFAEEEYDKSKNFQFNTSTQF